MTASTPSSPDRRDKKDPLRHGIYSQFFTPDEMAFLDNDPLRDLRDEENGLNLIVHRLLAEMKDSGNMTASDYRAVSRAVSFALGSIATIGKVRDTGAKGRSARQGSMVHQAAQGDPSLGGFYAEPGD
jgi:hypothetical protein